MSFLFPAGNCPGPLPTAILRPCPAGPAKAGWPWHSVALPCRKRRPRLVSTRQTPPRGRLWRGGFFSPVRDPCRARKCLH